MLILQCVSLSCRKGKSISSYIRRHPSRDRLEPDQTVAVCRSECLQRIEEKAAGQAGLGPPRPGWWRGRGAASRGWPLAGGRGLTLTRPEPRVS